MNGSAGMFRVSVLLAAAVTWLGGPSAAAAQGAAPAGDGASSQGAVRRVDPFTPPKSLRLKPLEPSQLSEAQRAVLGPGDAPLDVRLCVTNLPLCEKYFDLKTQLTTRRMSIPVRDHVMLALRTAYLHRSDAVWGSVVGVPGRLTLGSRALSPDEIDRVAAGPAAKGWTRFDAALLRAADEMHTYRFIHEPTWNALAFWYNEGQLFEVVMTIGQYTMMSGYFNSVGIPGPAGAHRMPAGKGPSQ